MARFVRHAGCPKCGSKDNRGVYDDGSEWCFGCHDYAKATSDKFVPSKEDESDDEQRGVGRRIRLLGELVEQSTRALPDYVLAYGAKYDISHEQLLFAGGRYFPPTNSLIFFYRGVDGELSCAQARTFNSQGPKYFNWGSTYPVLDINGTQGKSIVITEDKLSAVKVSQVCDASPALGTQFQNHKLLELMKRGYRKVYVWLDRDKWKEGREICEKAQWLGLSATALLSDEDPKCYSVDQIKEYLK